MREPTATEASTRPVDGFAPPANLGTILSVRGSVVDVLFEEQIPPMHQILRTGRDGQVLIEVLTHLTPHRVRGMALTPTQSLSRGEVVADTGGPLRVPVGKSTLARMLNLFGHQKHA